MASNNINPKQSSKILRAVSFYKYSFSFLMAIGLFVLPVLAPRPKFMESALADVLVRFILWLYLVFCYRSIFTAVTDQVNGVKGWDFEGPKSPLSFMLFAVNGIALGSLIWFLTRWSLLTFVPWLAEWIISLSAILNGAIYGIFAFSKYFWLIENK